MPLSPEEVSPLYAPSKDQVAPDAWQKKIAEFDAYIFTLPVTTGPTAVLKNALDYAYREWEQQTGFRSSLWWRGRCACGGELRLHASSCRWPPSARPYTSCADTISA